ncbi:MAG: VWA domain-containing protein [Candidatus Competibacteraceae bacterium]|nr:VWA domain-containing protein [Candidatus Competibacteraceae bacterium]
MKRNLLVGGAILSLGCWGAPAHASNSSVLFVLDGSGSMWGKIGEKAKIDIAKTVMTDMVAKLPVGIRAGLMVYGHNQKDDCNDIEAVAPMGSDASTITKALNEINPKGKTPLTGAIKLAAAQLRQVEDAASVVVVSDGKETCEGDPCAAAREATDTGVNLRIHVVGFDVAKEETDQLNCIAKEGKGNYYAAANAEQLVIAMTEVQKEVAAPPPPPPPKPAAEVLFEDQFNRSELGEMWQIINPDPNRLTLADDKLLIAASKVPDTVRKGGDFSLATPINLALLQKSPTGDFVATVKMTMVGAEGMRAGLFYWIDDQNFVFVGPWVRGEYAGQFSYAIAVGNRWRRPTFSKLVSNSKDEITLKGEQVGKRSIKDEASAEAWYLQLERSGVKFTAKISADGVEWKEIGTHILIPKTGRIGLGAYQDWRSGNEQPVEFENFVVKSLTK